FPMELSPFAYTETVAQEYYPLTGERRSDEIPNVAKSIPAAGLPDQTNDIPDDVLNWAIVCETTRRPFVLTKQELAFYRKRGLPLPRRHPDERHKVRMSLRNPRKLWNRSCAKCGREMQTTYSPERPEIVYCEKCYLKEVY
ncbi:MAG: hypothetical protein AAB853_03195, partial [Patescibacteria group bacterium]